MANEVPRGLWELAGASHNAKMELCYGKAWSPEYRKAWPPYEDCGQYMHEARQTWVDIALAQAKAVNLFVDRSRPSTVPPLQDAVEDDTETAFWAALAKTRWVP